MHKSKMHSNLYHPPKKKDIKTFKTKSIEIMPFLGPHFTSCIPSSAPGATLKCFSELSIPKKPSRPTQSDSGPVFYLYIRPRHVEHARPVLFCLFLEGMDDVCFLFGGYVRSGSKHTLDNQALAFIQWMAIRFCSCTST